MEAAKSIVLGLVIAHIDYANALCEELPESDIRKLLRNLNMAAKTGVTKYDSSTTALKTATVHKAQLHSWLPVQLCIKHKVLTLVFRCIHGLAPDYLCALIQPAPISRPGFLSESRVTTLEFG